jgi:import receptor subunit TOM70
VDEECDIALASLAQFLLHANKVPEALRAFEKAAEMSRTEMEIVNALQYAEAVRTQLEVRHQLSDEQR